VHEAGSKEYEPLLKSENPKKVIGVMVSKEREKKETWRGKKNRPLFKNAQQAMHVFKQGALPSGGRHDKGRGLHRKRGEEKNRVRKKRAAGSTYGKNTTAFDSKKTTTQPGGKACIKKMNFRHKGKNEKKPGHPKGKKVPAKANRKVQQPKSQRSRRDLFKDILEVTGERRR